MAVIAKTDIQTLTKQLNLEKCNISESIKAEYVPIDPSFLNESFVLELDAKMKYLKITQKNTPNAEVPISLDELENMVGRFDGLDKMFSESKASKISNTTRKEVSTMKRMYEFPIYIKFNNKSTNMFSTNDEKGYAITYVI